MDSSQNYADLLEPGIRKAKKRLDSMNSPSSGVADAMSRKKKLKRIKQKYGGYNPDRQAPRAQWQGDPNA